jgi:hypothetical protein
VKYKSKAKKIRDLTSEVGHLEKEVDRLVGLISIAHQETQRSVRAAWKLSEYSTDEAGCGACELSAPPSCIYHTGVSAGYAAGISDAFDDSAEKVDRLFGEIRAANNRAGKLASEMGRDLHSVDAVIAGGLWWFDGRQATTIEANLLDELQAEREAAIGFARSIGDACDTWQAS